MYEVLWFQAAVDQLLDVARRDFRDARRIATEVRTFERTGRGDIKKLQGSEGEWRLRAGDWRMRIAIQGRKVHVISIDIRRDAY
jgi:mRNA-degrading endonuclease RelE of RelBE toxin-antitoxin system